MDEWDIHRTVNLLIYNEENIQSLHQLIMSTIQGLHGEHK